MWKNGGNCKEYRNHRNRLKGVAYSMGFGANNNASFLSYFLLPISVKGDTCLERKPGPSDA